MTITEKLYCGCHVRQDYSYRLADGRVLPDMHADDVAEVLGLFETYTSAPSMSAEDAMALALAGWRACRERRAIQERAAQRRAETASRVRAEFARGPRFS